MKRTNKILYIVAVGILATVFLYCAASLTTYFLDSFKNQNTYNDLAELLEQNRPTIPAATTPPTTMPPVVSTEPSGTGTPPQQTTAPTEPTSPYVTVTDPETGEPVEMLPEFAALYELNNDLVGWIRLDDTTLNYPVVQRPEKTDYYLRRDFYRKSATHGCIYVREQCDVFAPSDNITIYGHRMRDGSMFAALANYEKKSYWEDHQYIHFDTLKERHTYQIISVFKTTATMGEGFRYHLFVDADGKKDFVTFMGNCEKLELYSTGLTAGLGDKLITLSTCEYTLENGRLVVVARRID